MTVYARQIASAQKIIAKKGGWATWRQLRDAPSADPAQPWKPVGNLPPVDFRVKIAFLPNSRVGFETLIAAATGAEILTGSVIGYMAHVPGLLPSKKDVVLRPALGTIFQLGTGIPYRIAKIDTLDVDGAIILHTVTFDV